MRVLVFNWHEAYLWLLGRVRARWLVADWHRPWSLAARPLPPGVRLCSAEAEARELVAGGQVDLVLCQTPMDLEWADGATVPLAYLAHNSLPNEVWGGGAPAADRLRARLAERVLGRGGLFVTISPMKRESWGLPATVIEPGVDAAEFPAWTGEVPWALTVANRIRERAHMLGWQELSAALAGLPWRLVGDNPGLGPHPGGPGNGNGHGPEPEGQPAPAVGPARDWGALRDLYRTHRLYCHATLWPWEDGYNLALLEAMATGMPVVAWANPTAAVTPGLTGFLAEDAAMFAHWVRRLLGDPDLARRIGERGREAVLERFPLALFLRDWEAALARAADPARGGLSAPAAGSATECPASRVPAVIAPRGPAGPRRRVVLATAWTPISTSMYYERAFRAGHDVLTWGPGMDAATLEQWRQVTEQHALKAAGLAEEKIRLLRGLSRPADLPAPEGQPSVADLLARLPRGWRPDLFVWIDGGPGFLPADLGRLDCPTVALVGDSHTQLDWRLAYARGFEHVFCMFNRQHVPRFERGGCRRVGWLPAACDPEIHRAFDVARAFDVVFVGQTLRQWHPDRVRLLERLAAAGLDVHVTTRILEEMALAFCRGRIVFNRSLAGDLNMRVFEALATESLLLTDRLPPEAGLDDLFTDREHLVCYDEDTLEALARHYLDHPAEARAIARAGRRAALASHTYRHRVAALLEAVLGESPAETRPPAVTVPAPALAIHDEPVEGAAAAEAPLASIVIPVWNRADMTARCLGALARTVDPARAEVLVVDNGSSDDTADVLARAPLPVRVVRNADNQGFARAANRGAREARGRLLVFLNNDTEPEPGWLQALEDAAADPEVGVVGARLLYPATRRLQHAGLALTAEGIPDHLWRNAPEDDPRALSPRDLDMVTGACLAIRRDLFLDLGGFDEGYDNGCEDVDLCLAARRAGRRVRYEPRAVVLHHEGATPGRFAHVDRNLRRLAERWGDALARLPRLPREAFGEEPGPLVAWEGAFFRHHSLAGINRALCRELLALGVDLTLTPSEGEDFDPGLIPEGPRLARLVNRPAPRPPVLRVRHRFPPDLTPLPGERLVVIQPWEFGAPPADWVAGIAAHVEELWVPSEFVRQGFLRAGLPPERVVVIPNGFDPAVFHPGAEPVPLPTARACRFLYVGGSLHRKGLDLLLQAYLEEFSDADDVCLIVKDHAYYRHRLHARLAEVRRQAGAPEILYYWDDVAPGRMAGFYAAAHWLVHPFRGEGFGLPILEALACGRPVIVTDAGPVREFCPEEAALFVPASTVEFPEARVEHLETVGRPHLAEPDPRALRRALRHAYAEREAWQERGLRAAARVHARDTWAHVARRYAERLRALLARPAGPRAAPPEATAEGLALLAQGRVEEALPRFASALARDPGDVDALVGAAHCALAVEETGPARVFLARVLALAPDHAGARAALAVLDGEGAEARQA